MVRLLGNVALGVAVAGCGAFVVAYAALADWRSTPLGRNVMAFMAALLAMLALAVLRNFTPLVDRYVDWFRLGAVTTVAVIAWQRVYLLIKAQVDTRRAERGYGGVSMHADDGGQDD